MGSDYLKWKSVFVKILDEEYDKSAQKMHCHDASHHLRVWELAETVADKYGADKEVLIAACLLHDISAQRVGLDHSNSQVNDARIAKEMLLKVSFPEEKIQLVIDAIGAHGSDPKFKEKRVSIEGQILCDCDKLESLGPIGVARIISALITRGKSLKEIARMYHNGKIEQKYNAIVLPELKERAKADYAYSKDFFRRLAETLGVDNC